MSDISFLVFQDDQGYYRLEGSNQTRIDMTEQEANAQIAAQHREEWNEAQDEGETTYYFEAEIDPLISHRTFKKEIAVAGTSEQNARDFAEYKLEEEYPGEAYLLLSLECLNKNDLGGEKR